MWLKVGRCYVNSAILNSSLQTISRQSTPNGKRKVLFNHETRQLTCLSRLFTCYFTCIMSVRVVARIRPLLDKELDKNTIVRAESSHEGKPANLVRIPNPKNEAEEFSFAFNSVYDMATTQEELFTNEGMPVGPRILKKLTSSSRTYNQISFPRARYYNFCIWRYRNGKDTYYERGSQIVGERSNTAIAQCCLSQSS